MGEAYNNMSYLEKMQHLYGFVRDAERIAADEMERSSDSSHSFESPYYFESLGRRDAFSEVLEEIDALLQ